MKKSQILIFSFLSLLFIQKTNAQWSITPNIGVNNARIIIPRSPYKTDIEAANFVAVGIAPRYRFSKRIAVETNFQYSEKGEKRIKASYIDIIPTLEYSPLPYLSIYSGVSIGRKLFERISYDNKTWEKHRLGRSLYGNYNIGALLGVRAKYKNLQLSFHADRGLNPQSKITFTNDNGDVTNVLKEYLLVYQLTLGYSISLGEK